MTVYVVTSQVDYDHPYIEGVWATEEGALEWINEMQKSHEAIGDYHTDYYCKEYTVR